MDDKEFLTLEDVADMLGVTYQLVYKLAKSGELPAIRIGKLYRVARSDLMVYLEEQKNNAADSGGGTCSVCGEVYRSRYSLKHKCQESECEEPICNDCWVRLGIRKCYAHGKNTK